MIKATDLRINNWYLMNGREFYLEMHWLNQWAKGKLDLSKISGIPLTEEWLLKLGFEYGIKSLSRFRFEWDNGFIIIAPDNGSGDISVKCEYVHTFQNLYFALTGEELTIKE